MFWTIVKARAKAHNETGKWPPRIKMTQAQYEELKKETGLTGMRFLDMDIVI